ncbi:MAG: MFS transporter [Candidatus Marinimicrobia bacterium]|nr:MFS transporter [Candidatus Neomarinimicrobiota bacterium]|tara:strand:- start:4654 stop:5949 length:1296 start_codon:yes stop_codon:yes gene_type:complete
MISEYKRTVFSWSLYDFANQPFTTITITFIYSTFFASTIFLGSEEAGVAAWGKAITISSLIVAFLSPFMGAIADRGGYRKLFLMFWTWVCVLFSFLLYFPLPGDVFKALLFFCVANIGFEMGGVFLNAYLPEIAPKNKIGRISGYGWSFGYVGGLLALSVCFIFLVFPENPINPLTGNTFNKNSFEHIRIINVIVAIWLAVFSIPTFLFVKSNKKTSKKRDALISKSFLEFKKTFLEIKQYKEILRFLFARIVYNDALITVIAFGGPYAYTQFGFDMDTNGKLMIFAIVLNVFAGIGAFLFGFIDDCIGGKKTIQLTNLGFIIALIIAFLAPSLKNGEIYFWISGILIGIFMGPNQAASRSLMGRLIPENKENEFYGFFAFSGKATAFLGPLLFTIVISYTDSMRLSLLMLAFLFLIGMILLKKVKDPQMS